MEVGSSLDFSGHYTSVVIIVKQMDTMAFLNPGLVNATDLDVGVSTGKRTRDYLFRVAKYRKIGVKKSNPFLIRSLLLRVID